MEISKVEYEAALSISEDKDFQLHLKRPPNSCFVNNYFSDGLLSWEANLDIQPVFNHYKAVAYMCSYLSKSEDECSQAMSQAVKEAFEHNLDNYQQMKSVAHSYVNKRECSIQECVYHILAGQWLRKTFPGVIFANSNVPEKRYRICRDEKDISELPEDSTDIFKRNMIDRYIDRPNLSFGDGKYSIVDSFCFAEFLRYYYLAPFKSKDNDYQPEILQDDLVEHNHVLGNNYPTQIPMMSSNEKLKCRKVPYVLKYYVPNKHTKPEEYAHHILFMYYPFRDENDLKSNNSYVEKLNQPNVLEVINLNRMKVEPYATLVEDALERLATNQEANIDPFGQCENNEVHDRLNEECQNLDIDESFRDDMIYIDIGFGCNRSTLPVFQDSIISENIRSLNLKQRQVFEVIHKWSRDYVKNLSSKVMKKVKPFHIFLTGGGGVGKSHLIKTIYMSINKVLMYKGGNPEKPRILLLAPTGVAAVNIDGTTIHTALGINVGGKLYPLNDRQRGILRNKLAEVKFIIIDEISMVSNVLLYQVHQRLNVIYGCSAELPFAGLPVLACGDLYQLPPVKGAPIYCNTGNIKGYLSLDLWRGFKMAELTEVMRQQGDYNFISLLNEIRTGVVDNEVERLLLSRFVAKDNPLYLRHAVHIFAENSPAVDDNDLMLNEMEGQTISINAIDDIPHEVQLSDKQIDAIRARKIGDTRNLVF